jgi:hypothetical protein
MAEVPDDVIQGLCRELHLDVSFFMECVRASAVKIEEIDGKARLGNATALRLRRLERICDALDVDVSVALLLLELTRRVEELEERLRLARAVP